MKIDEQRERAELEKQAAVLEDLLKKQLEAMMVLSQKINQLGGTADPKKPAIPPPPVRCPALTSAFLSRALTSLTSS